MMKILFLIHDLGQGGAEKVLVNLVNNLDQKKFNITVVVLFGGGVNEKSISSDIRLETVFPKEIPGNSKLMKLLTPRQLHRLCVKDKYDIEVSYLEGPSARVISGCANTETKLIAWIHSMVKDMKEVSSAFRSYTECKRCYKKYDKIVCVSDGIRKSFGAAFDCLLPLDVVNNTVDSNEIIKRSLESIERDLFHSSVINIITVGTLKHIKGYDRLLRIFRRLREEKYPVHLYILGIGPMKSEMENFIKENRLTSCVSFLGYQTNPYKYVARSDLYICSSYSEGFSTAVTEALIVGTPVCTVDVSGMKEMLGNNEYGLITENNEQALFLGIKSLLDSPEKLAYYKKQAQIRGKIFSTKETVKAVEKLFLDIQRRSNCGH